MRPLPPQDPHHGRAVPAEAPTVAFLFPWPGAQHVNMGREAALYHRGSARSASSSPSSYAGRAAAGAPERPHVPRRPPSMPRPSSIAGQAPLTGYALRAAGHRRAVARLSAFRRNVSASVPVAAAGHSYGEYTALLAAGAIELRRFPCACPPSAVARWRRPPAVSVPGGMVAVQAARDQVQPQIADLDGVVVANHNAPQQSVDLRPQGRALRRPPNVSKPLACARLLLPVAGAFHTELVAPAKAALSAAIHATPFRAREADGLLEQQRRAVIRRMRQRCRPQLDQHLLSSVEFVSEIEAMHAAGVRVFVELGPRGICAGLACQISKAATRRRSRSTPARRACAALQLGFGGLVRRRRRFRRWRAVRIQRAISSCSNWLAARTRRGAGARAVACLDAQRRLRPAAT